MTGKEYPYPPALQGQPGGCVVILLAAALFTFILVGLVWIGRDSGPGPDHRCNVVLYRDGSWKPDGWAPEPWPTKRCNFVVLLDRRGQ